MRNAIAGATLTPRALLACATAIAVVACGDSTTAAREGVSGADLGAALASVPVGYGELASSFVGGAAAAAGGGALWVGGGLDARMGRDEMMGGGLQGAFLGGDVGRHGPFGNGLGCAGTFSDATGRVTCDSVTLGNGLSVLRSASFADAQGHVQQAFDSATTDVVNVQATVSGSVTFAASGDSVSGDSVPGDSVGRRGRGHWGVGRGPGGRLLGDTATILFATITLRDASDRTVSGLAPGSTQRTVNGTSAGQEGTSGISSHGRFTATRTVADTTSGLVVPVRTGAPTYPTAGTVVRVMEATFAETGQAPTTVSRREVVTYDGSATAQVAITENGTTRECTRALPRGRLDCP